MQIFSLPPHHFLAAFFELCHPQCPVLQLGMDLDGEEPIQEDDEDEMGWQESTKEPGMLESVSWEFYLHLLTHFKPTLNQFCILLPGFPERGCKVLEA